MIKWILSWMIFFIAWCPDQALAQQFDHLFDKANKIEIPFDFVNGFIVMDITYGKGLPLKFIFDTGAEYSILTHKEYAIVSGATIGREVIILGADMSSKIRADVIHGNRLNLGGQMQINNVNMILLGDDYLDLGKYVGFPIHGVIGANIFSRYLVEINYKKNIITFHNARNNQVRYKGYHEMDADFISRKPYLQMSVEMSNGQTFTGKFLVDCGAEVSLLMVLGSHEQLKIPKNTLLASIASGLGGSMKGYMGRVNHMELASVTYHSPIVHYQEIRDSLQFDTSNKNGIIGNRLLSRYNVLIDYPNRKLFLKPYHKKYRQMRVDKSGLSIIASGPYLKQLSIAHVLHNTVAEKAGLQAGDIIRRINGFPSSFWGVASIAKKMTKKEGKKIKLVVLRDGKKVKVTFRLKKYI